MSRVYRVWDPDRGCHVALKYLRAREPDWIRRMRREARVQARLRHPNIARVYDTGEHDGRPYIAMQYIDGRPLNELMPTLSLEAGLALLLDVCDALHYAQRHGLVHRDIKPANILIAEVADGGLHPYVLDFGLAKSVGDETLTMAGEVFGTPAYMSPEQARGETRRIDRRSDVFSIGSILFELCTGHSPFAGEPQSETLTRVLACDAPRPRKLNPDTPRALERVCLQALEREPARRYQSVADLRRDLERFLAGEPVRARATGLGFRALRLWRRNRPVAGDAALAALERA